MSREKLTIEQFDDLFCRAGIEYELPPANSLERANSNEAYNDFLVEYFEEKELDELAEHDPEGKRTLAFDLAIYIRHQRKATRVAPNLAAVLAQHHRRLSSQSEQKGNYKNLLTQALEIVEGEEWMQYARCAQEDVDPSIFFPVMKKRIQAEAQEICQTQCSVRNECLDFAIENHPVHGIWGGLALTAREKLVSANDEQKLEDQKRKEYSGAA